MHKSHILLYILEKDKELDFNNMSPNQFFEILEIYILNII